MKSRGIKNRQNVFMWTLTMLGRKKTKYEAVFENSKTTKVPFSRGIDLCDFQNALEIALDSNGQTYFAKYLKSRVHFGIPRLF